MLLFLSWLFPQVHKRQRLCLLWTSMGIRILQVLRCLLTFCTQRIRLIQAESSCHRQQGGDIGASSAYLQLQNGYKCICATVPGKLPLMKVNFEYFFKLKGCV